MARPDDTNKLPLITIILNLPGVIFRLILSAKRVSFWFLFRIFSEDRTTDRDATTMSADKKRPLEETSPEDENPAKKQKLDESTDVVITEANPAESAKPTPTNNNNQSKANKDGNDDDEDEIDVETGKKIPKRRVALLVGYLGANFQGLQKYAFIDFFKIIWRS